MSPANRHIWDKLTRILFSTGEACSHGCSSLPLSTVPGIILLSELPLAKVRQMIVAAFRELCGCGKAGMSGMTMDVENRGRNRTERHKTGHVPTSPSADSRADSVEFCDGVCHDSRIRRRRIGCWKCPRHQVMATWGDDDDLYPCPQPAGRRGSQPGSLALNRERL